MASIKEQTVNSAKWALIDKGANQGVNFLFSILMARILMPEDFGVLAIITVVVSITSLFIDCGFSSALIRKPRPSELDFSTVFYFNIIIALLCYVLIFIASPYFASFFNMPILKDALRVQSLSLIVQSFAAVQIAQLTINLDFRTLAIQSVIASIISCCIAICMAFLELGIWALVAQTLLFAIIYTTLIIINQRWRPSTGFSKESFKELGSYGSKLLLSSLIHNLYHELTSILIGKFYTAKDLGYFKRGSDFANLPTMTINGVVTKVTFPILSKIQEDTSRLVSVYRKYIKTSSMIIFIFCISLSALAKPLVLIVLGDKWAQSIIYLQIFSFSCMFNHIGAINLNLLKVVGRSDLYLRLEIIKKTISVVMILIAVNYGVLAICISMFIYNQISIIINTYYTGKLFGLGYWAQVKDFAKYLIAALLSASPAYLLTFSKIANILVLFLGLFMSFSIYYILLRKDSLAIDTLKMLNEQIKNTICR